MVVRAMNGSSVRGTNYIIGVGRSALVFIFKDGEDAEVLFANTRASNYSDDYITATRPIQGQTWTITPKKACTEYAYIITGNTFVTNTNNRPAGTSFIIDSSTISSLFFN